MVSSLPLPVGHDVLLGLVAQLAEADDLDAYSRLATEGIRRLVPGLFTVFMEMDLEAGLVSHHRADPPEAIAVPGVGSAHQRYMAENPLIRHHLATGDTRALTWDEVADDLDAFRAGKLYREVFARLGVASQLGVALPAPAGLFVGFAVHRGPEGFTDRDRLVLQTLRPHLAHAHRAVRTRMAEARWRSVLAVDGWSVVLVDAAGVVRHISGPGVELTSGVPTRPGDPLPDALRSTFLQAVAAYDPRRPSAVVPLGPPASGVRLAPSPVPPHVLLVRRPGPDLRRLAALGLTARQIEVAAALAAGGTNAQIARRLGIAAGTVRKHLEAIYATLQVDNRAAALRVILGG